MRLACALLRNGRCNAKWQAALHICDLDEYKAKYSACLAALAMVLVNRTEIFPLK